jgi:hypothetical protein
VPTYGDQSGVLSAVTCTASPSGYVGNNPDLIGPIPASGGTITNLFVQLDNNVTGTGASWTATVLDNGVPTAVFCTIPTGSQSCTSGASVAIAAGHWLQVKVTSVNGPAGRNWRVSFRY